MNKHIKLYSFGNFDRSGKVRWTAEELGYEIEESRLNAPQQRDEAYRVLNPYAQVPTAELEGKILLESTAIAVILAERHPEYGLIPATGDSRETFWQSLSIASSTLEQLTVNYFVSKSGIIDAAWMDLVGEPFVPALRRALETRDRGCRFPGCGLRFTDAHHVKHWADGGETSLGNLVLLCSYHHRLVHEEKWQIEWWGEGRPAFIDPRGQKYFDARPTPSQLPSDQDPVDALIEDTRSRGADPDYLTAGARWKREADIPDRIYFRATEAMG